MKERPKPRPAPLPALTLSALLIVKEIAQLLRTAAGRGYLGRPLHGRLASEQAQHAEAPVELLPLRVRVNEPMKAPAPRRRHRMSHFYFARSWQWAWAGVV